MIAEKHKYSRGVWYAYTPAGTGDWYRWRLATPELIGSGYDQNYVAVCGVLRGNVYDGIQKDYSEYDNNNGFTATSAYYKTFRRAYTTTYGQYLIYTVPENMTHHRIWFRCGSGQGIMRVSYLDSAESEIGYYTFAQEQAAEGTNFKPYIWKQIPAGTAKIKLSKEENNSDLVCVTGIDFINRNMVVTPDKPGSMMMDWDGGDTRDVNTGNEWGVALGINKTSVEIAVSWADKGTAYDGLSFGGISHRGIALGSGSVTWQIQKDNTAPAIWAPAAGEKILADYLILSFVNLDVMRKHDTTDVRGTLNGSLVFDCSGVIIDYDIENTYSDQMDLYEAWLIQFRTNTDIDHVYFDGDTEVREVKTSSVYSPIKTSRVCYWAGASKTQINLYNLSPEDYDYYKDLNAVSYPRVFADSGSHKVYFQSYENQTTPKAIAIGEHIKTRFRIGLTAAELGVGVTLVERSRNRGRYTIGDKVAVI